MRQTSKFSFFPSAVISVTAAFALISGIACRPIKIDKSKTGAAKGCTDATIAVGGTCIKDGFVYLLHDATIGKAESSAGKTSIAFGKQNLVKGDKIFATSRISLPKSTNGSNVALNYQVGSTNVGTTSSQYQGDPDSISIVRNLLAYQVPDTIDAQVAMMTSIPSSGSTNGEGSLLIFRQTQLAYALDPRNKKDDPGPYFVSAMLDSDNLKTSELKVAAPSPVIENELKNVKPGDLLLIRGGLSWEIAEGKASSCDGTSVSWSLSLGQKEVTSEGFHLINSTHTASSISLQTIYRVPADPVPGQVSINAKFDIGNKTDRNSCALRIEEPATLSVIIFRTISDLPGEIQTARFLQDLGSVSAKPGKFSSNQSGPPIETLLSLNWEHQRSDALLTDIGLTIAAEDRLQQTKVYAQLSRAPDGLSSHLGKTLLMSPEKPRTISITDLAIEDDLTTLTRFYLTGMAFNNDSKNVLINEAQIFFMHFRRIGDRL